MKRSWAWNSWLFQALPGEKLLEEQPNRSQWTSLGKSPWIVSISWEGDQAATCFFLSGGKKLPCPNYRSRQRFDEGGLGSLLRLRVGAPRKDARNRGGAMVGHLPRWFDVVCKDI